MPHTFTCPFCYGDERLLLVALVAHLLGCHRCDFGELNEILSRSG